MYKDYKRLLLSWRKDKVLSVTHKGIWIMEEVLFSKTFKANFRLSFYYYKCEFPWPLWKQMEARIQVGVFLWYLWRNCFLSFLRNRIKPVFEYVLLLISQIKEFIILKGFGELQVFENITLSKMSFTLRSQHNETKCASVGAKSGMWCSLTSPHSN